jgi:purine-nucleoside phosphorylase
MIDETFHLTPLDVRRYEFGKAMRGYDPERVNQFREQVAEELERLSRINQDLDAKARGFHEQLRAFRERDKAINEALVSAQQLRTDIGTGGQKRRSFFARRADAERSSDEARLKFAGFRISSNRSNDRAALPLATALVAEVSWPRFKRQSRRRSRTSRPPTDRARLLLDGSLVGMSTGSAGFGSVSRGAETHVSASIDEAAAAVRASLARRRTSRSFSNRTRCLAAEISTSAVIEYADIPGLLSTVESHAGRLLCGTLAGKTVVAMQGRFHKYEGYSLQAVTFPVRVMRALGADTLVVSNACGGLNPLWSAGDLMLIADHINLLGDSPLIGPNDDRLGPRFPDLSNPYDTRLRTIARDVAAERRITLREGVYVAVTGPNLETRAEYRFLRNIGADVVGMSTVPEVVVAIHAGMRVLAVHHHRLSA